MGSKLAGKAVDRLLCLAYQLRQDLHRLRKQLCLGSQLCEDLQGMLRSARTLALSFDVTGVPSTCGEL